MKKQGVKSCAVLVSAFIACTTLGAWCQAGSSESLAGHWTADRAASKVTYKAGYFLNPMKPAKRPDPSSPSLPVESNRQKIDEIPSEWIHQTANKITIDSGSPASGRELTADGVEHKSRLPSGDVFISSSHWDGDTFQTTWSIESGGLLTTEGTDRITPDPQTHTLIDDRTVKTATGQDDYHLIWKKNK
jgi:hypothetical protein